MLTCWETFILKCAEQSGITSAIEGLKVLQLKLLPQENERFHKLVNTLVDFEVAKEYLNNS